jgi:rRNA maturation protein Rpf1
MDRLGHGDLVKDLQHLLPIETMLKRFQLNFQDVDQLGTGSVTCNSAFVLHLCRFLNQEELMEREAMVQNP